MIKKLILSIIVCCVAGVLYAQRTEDVIYMTNGKIIRGRIVEESPEGDIKIMSTDQTIHLIDAADIRRKTQETVEVITSSELRRRTPPDIKVPYGYFLGFSIASFVNDGISPTARPGAHIGVFVERPLNDRFSVVPEIQLAMKGGKYDYKDSQYGVDELDPDDENYDEGHGVEVFELRDMHRNDMLVYLHVPVLFEAKLELPSGYLFAGAGPYVSYGVYSHTFDMEQNRYNKKENPPFYYNVYHNYDFGAAFRLGYQTSGSFFFQAGYERSLFDIKPSQTYAEGETRFSVKNSVFTFTVGRRFK